MKRVSVVLLIVVTMLLAGAWVCNVSQYHTANRAAKQIADDVHEFAATVTKMCAPVAGVCSGSITNDEAKALAHWANDASIADDQFLVQLEAANVSTGAQGQQILAAFNQLSQAIETLNSQGVLHLKSTAAQARFQQIYSAIETALVLIQDIVAPAPHSQNKPSPILPMQQAMVDPTLLLTAALSLLKLVAQFKADGSLTDEQIQAATAAENEDTRRLTDALLLQLKA